MKRIVAFIVLLFVCSSAFTQQMQFVSKGFIIIKDNIFHADVYTVTHIENDIVGKAYVFIIPEDGTIVTFMYIENTTIAKLLLQNISIKSEMSFNVAYYNIKDVENMCIIKCATTYGGVFEFWIGGWK